MGSRLCWLCAVFAFSPACASAPSPARSAPASARPAAQAPAGVLPQPALGGAWQGSLLTGKLRLVLRMERTAAGWSAAMDSPDQNAHDIRAGAVRAEGDQLEVLFPQIDGRYAARVSETALSGTWTQHGHRTALELKRTSDGPPSGAPAGVWEGNLETRLTVVLHVVASGSGWAATADSPDQHARGLPVQSVAVSGSSAVFAMPTLDASYTARVDGDRLVGVFTQHGRTFPLELTRTEHPVAAEPRPQQPVRPLPYEEHAVTITGGAAGVELACTLTKPPGAGPFAAVFLATGSGPHDRDETILGHKPFLVLADAITRAGLEVLRCDDRGVGASTGSFDRATTLDFADDALAAVTALRARPEVVKTRVGILGHSEGGIVAPVAASRSPNVAFVVLLAPPALPGRDLLHLQRAWLERRAGESADEIARTRARWDEAYAIVVAEHDDAAAKARLRHLYEQLPAPARADIDRSGGADNAISHLLTPWFRTFLALDPRDYLAHLRVPVLALFGERDMQVDPKANLPQLRKALATDADVTVRELPGLNHLLQPATTGAPEEYGEIEQTISPAVLAIVTDWLARHARAAVAEAARPVKTPTF